MVRQRYTGKQDGRRLTAFDGISGYDLLAAPLMYGRYFAMSKLRVWVASFRLLVENIHHDVSLCTWLTWDQAMNLHAYPYQGLSGPWPTLTFTFVSTHGLPAPVARHPPLQFLAFSGTDVEKNISCFYSIV